MANYHEMDRDALTAEKAALEQAYKEFQAKGLKLNMARGKPGPHQMDLAMDLLKMTDYTTDAGTDARNYGELEGLSEARALFADVFGVKPNEVFVGGNSSLQLMYNLINIGYVFGFPESPCPWSQVEKRKFLCPVPGYDRHFAITEEFGFELISVPMTPNGPDMDVVEKLVAEDDTIKGIWCVPQYSNPDGYTYSDETIELFASSPDYAEMLEKYIKLAKDVDCPEDNDKYPESIRKSKSLMAIYDNTGEDEKLAIRIHKAVKKQALFGFRDNQVVIRRIKKALYEILGDDSEVERIYKIIEKQEEF